MAQKMNAETELGADGTNNLHNAKARADIIRECAGQMLEIKRERSELNERAADIRERLKDAGVQTKAFEFAVKLAEMEQEARNDYLDSFHECFDSLGVGGQLDWISATAA